MINQALRYEFHKFGIKRLIILFAIIAIMIVLYYVVIPNYDNNDYYDNLLEWSNSVEKLKDANLNLSPNQKTIFDKYSKIIPYKVSLLKQYDRNRISSSYNVCARMEEIKNYYCIALFLISFFLAIVILGREQNNSEINQGLIMPWKRSSIYIAKLVFVAIILLAFATMCFGVSYIMSTIYGGGRLIAIDYVYLNGQGQCSTIGFGVYYLFQFLLALIPALSIYIFLTMLLIILKKSLLSIIVFFLSMMGFKLFSFVGEYMGYFWYNLFPTKSFNIVEYIFSNSMINELDTLNNQMKYVVNHKFDICTILFYDIYILIMLLCISIDRFRVRDY